MIANVQTRLWKGAVYVDKQQLTVNTSVYLTVRLSIKNTKKSLILV